jgi:proteic killer suppression protein
MAATPEQSGPTEPGLQVNWRFASLCNVSLTCVRQRLTFDRAIRTFRSKALSDLWSSGRTSKIDTSLHRRVLARLDALDVAEAPEDMNVPGFDFHALRGFKPTRFTVHVNGPWCITFEFDGADATQVDIEQYH